MTVLARNLDTLLPEAMRSAKLPALCECSRLNPRHWVKPKGEPGRYVCGVCYEAERRSDPAEFRAGHDPAKILP